LPGHSLHQMAGSFNLKPALAGKSRKSPNRNIVTTLDPRFDRNACRWVL
jgi:hypothetical protein